MKAWRDIPYFWTTDVNGAGWAEYVSGAAKDVENVVYLTVGTGVGAGIIQHGQLLSGNSHPEAGHIMMRKHPQDSYVGHCPFHGDNCLEGLAPVQPLKTVGKNRLSHCQMITWPGKSKRTTWRKQPLHTPLFCVQIALYLVVGCHTVEVLLPMVRKSFAEQLADYLIDDPDKYLVTVGNGDNAGILGCFYLAKQLVEA